MTSPFPGMDPYLEDRQIWPGFHHSCAEEIRTVLNAHIGPKYYADVEVHTVFEDISISTTQSIYPDVGIIEPVPEGPMFGGMAAEAVIAPAPVQRPAVLERTKYRTVRVHVTDTDELVTAIEILSPANKRGDGLAEYRRKRLNVHLVEIDLLRGGQRPALEVNNPPLQETDYVLLVNRYQIEDRQRLSEIWPVSLNEVLPIIPIPLLPPDPDVPLDLNAVIRAVYTRAGYAWRIKYDRPVPPPKLRADMAAWVKGQISSE